MRHVKVTKLRILKPADDLSWKELGELLREARYRTYRLANLAISEAYLNFHMFRTGRAKEYKKETIGQLSKRLRQMLIEEGASEESLNRFSKNSALPELVYNPLQQNKIRALTSPSKWRDVIRGKSSLPTFRLNMAIPIKCDRTTNRHLEKMDNGNVELDLTICSKPYPRIILQTGKIGFSDKAILDRLLENRDQSDTGYKQRVFEIKFDENKKQWWLYITYDFPAEEKKAKSKDIIVGVDVGVSCPMFAAINNGHARMGRRQFTALGARIRSLQTQVMSRRRSMLTGGRVSLSKETARSGHGRKRKILSIEKLNGRINRAYNTLNHQLSSSIIDFACNHGAGLIQMEDLSSLKDKLSGTFLGERWRYHQLQEFVKYKSNEAGVELKFVNPRYTSRRCSECGYIHIEFDRSYRDRNRSGGKVTKFKCPECEYEADPDYNAARNLATIDIDKKISLQCKKQKIDSKSESSLSTE